MNIYRSIVVAAVPVTMLWAQPASATRDFRDVGFLFAKVSDALESEPTGSVVPWHNPETGSRGSISVTRTVFLADGLPCREYARSTDSVSGTPDQELGTGCRDQDGRWTLTEGRPAGSGPISLVPAADPPASAQLITTEPLPPATPPPAAAAVPPPAVATARPPAAPVKTLPQSAAKPMMPRIASATIPSRSD